MRKEPESNPNMSAWWLLTVPLFVVLSWQISVHGVLLLAALPGIVIVGVTISFLGAWMRPGGYGPNE